MKKIMFLVLLSTLLMGCSPSFTGGGFIVPLLPTIGAIWFYYKSTKDLVLENKRINQFVSGVFAVAAVVIFVLMALDIL